MARQKTPSKMKAEKSPESSSSDETTNQKQDPLERRRLQNRVSQRNHRRKIRDRIAKLQERVIANELKAAAALHGWDQQFVPSPITPTYHVQYPNNSHDISLATSSTTMSTDSLMSFTPSFNVSPASFWSSDMMVPLSPTFMPADSCANMTIPVSNPHTQIGTHALMDGALEANAFQDISPTADSVFPESFKPTTNQPLCYAATGATLPHLIQMLSSMSPQSKIIILVPPDPASASTAGYPSPTPTLTGNGGLDSLQLSSLNGACPCHAQSVHGMSSGQMGPHPWRAPGSHQPGRPSHKDFHAELGRS